MSGLQACVSKRLSFILKLQIEFYKSFYLKVILSLISNTF